MSRTKAPRRGLAAWLAWASRVADGRVPAGRSLAWLVGSRLSRSPPNKKIVVSKRHLARERKLPSLRWRTTPVCCPCLSRETDSAVPVGVAHRAPDRCAAAGPSSAEDLEVLRNAYMNEKFAPELLPHNEELLERLKQVVEEQVRVHGANDPNLLPRLV